MGSITIAGVEDVSLINLHLGYISRKLTHIKVILEDTEGLSSDIEYSLIRVNLIDIQHSATKVLEQEGITDEILEKYSVKRLIALNHLILVPYGNVPTTVVLDSFKETMFKDLYMVYGETFDAYFKLREGKYS